MDDRSAIEQVIRQYFSLDDRDVPFPVRWQAKVDLTTGKLRELLELWSWPSDGDFSLRIEKLHVDLVEETTATASLIATRVEHVDWPDEGRTVVNYGGPVVLEKVGSAWKIVDFTIDGARLLDTVVTGLDTRQEVDSLLLRVLAVVTGKDGISVLVELRNAGAGDAQLAWTAGRGLLSWQNGWVDTSVVVAPGETRTTDLQLPRAAIRWGRRPRLLLAVRAAGREIYFDVVPRLDGPAILARPSQPPRSITAQRWLLGRPIVLLIAVVAGLFASGSGSTVGPLLIGTGVFVMLYGSQAAARGGIGRATRPLAYGFAITIVGAALALATG